MIEHMQFVQTMAPKHTAFLGSIITLSSWTPIRVRKGAHGSYPGAAYLSLHRGRFSSSRDRVKETINCSSRRTHGHDVDAAKPRRARALPGLEVRDRFGPTRLLQCLREQSHHRRRCRRRAGEHQLLGNPPQGWVLVRDAAASSTFLLDPHDRSTRIQLPHLLEDGLSSFCTCLLSDHAAL